MAPHSSTQHTSVHSGSWAHHGAACATKYATIKPHRPQWPLPDALPNAKYPGANANATLAPVAQLQRALAQLRQLRSPPTLPSLPRNARARICAERAACVPCTPRAAAAPMLLSYLESRRTGCATALLTRGAEREQMGAKTVCVLARGAYCIWRARAHAPLRVGGLGGRAGGRVDARPSPSERPPRPGWRSPSERQRERKVT